MLCLSRAYACADHIPLHQGLYQVKSSPPNLSPSKSQVSSVQNPEISFHWILFDCRKLHVAPTGSPLNREYVLGIWTPQTLLLSRPPFTTRYFNHEISVHPLALCSFSYHTYMKILGWRPYLEELCPSLRAPHRGLVRLPNSNDSLWF